MINTNMHAAHFEHIYLTLNIEDKHDYKAHVKNTEHITGISYKSNSYSTFMMFEYDF